MSNHNTEILGQTLTKICSRIPPTLLLLRFFPDTIPDSTLSEYDSGNMQVHQSNDEIKLSRRNRKDILLRTFLISIRSILLSTFQSQWGLYQYVNILEGASQYYANIANPTIVVKTTIYVLQTSLADIVIIWHCYVVNTKKWYAIVPPAAVVIVNMCKFYTSLDGLESHLIGIVGAGFYTTWAVSQAHPGSNIFQTPATWITTFFILTMSMYPVQVIFGRPSCWDSLTLSNLQLQLHGAFIGLLISQAAPLACSQC